MTKREAVIKALSHEYVSPVPYCLNMTDDVARRMTEATGDPDFADHAGSYLVTEINESFVDLEDGRFKDMFGVTWDRGRQEGTHYGLPALEAFHLPEDQKAVCSGEKQGHVYCSAQLRRLQGGIPGAG